MQSVNNYRDIKLPIIAGKFLACIVLNRLKNVMPKKNTVDLEVQFNSVSQPWTECKNVGSGCHASNIAIYN